MTCPATSPARRSAQLDRRTFIGSLTVLLTCTVPWQLAVSSTAAGSADLIARLSDLTASAQLGRHYLLTHPDERTASVLVDALQTALTSQPQAPLASGAKPELADTLTALILSEYQTAPLVAVDGWLLAPSEARLYALSALLLPVDNGLQLTAPPHHLQPPNARPLV